MPTSSHRGGDWPDSYYEPVDHMMYPNEPPEDLAHAGSVKKVLSKDFLIWTNCVVWWVVLGYLVWRWFV